MLGLLDVDELEEAVDGKDLTADQKKAVALCRVNAAVDEGLQLARAGGIDDTVEEFVDIYEEGVLPTQNTYGFWYILQRHANANGDAALLEASIRGLRGILGRDDERANKWLAKLEARLAELKGTQK